LQTMKNAEKMGKSISIVRQKRIDSIENDLSHAIKQFVGIERIHEYIPECQTNFVYSEKNPISTVNILGVEGRIVKTGKLVTIAGILKYGGSRHVASAVLQMTKKFTSIRCAIKI